MLKIAGDSKCMLFQQFLSFCKTKSFVRTVKIYENMCQTIKYAICKRNKFTLKISLKLIQFYILVAAGLNATFYFYFIFQ